VTTKFDNNTKEMSQTKENQCHNSFMVYFICPFYNDVIFYSVITNLFIVVVLKVIENRVILKLLEII